jgi:hypothetical protein
MNSNCLNFGLKKRAVSVAVECYSRSRWVAGSNPAGGYFRDWSIQHNLLSIFGNMLSIFGYLKVSLSKSAALQTTCALLLHLHGTGLKTLSYCVTEIPHLVPV